MERVVAQMETNKFFAAILRADIYKDSDDPEATEKNIFHFPVCDISIAKRSTTLEVILPASDRLIKIGVIMELGLRRGDIFWSGNGRVFFGENERNFWSFSGFSGDYHCLIIKTSRYAEIDVMVGGRIVCNEVGNKRE